MNKIWCAKKTSKNAYAEYFRFIKNLDSLAMALLEIGLNLKLFLTVMILIQNEVKGINQTGINQTWIDQTGFNDTGKVSK